MGGSLMALVTRFSREEMAYLQGLPVYECASTAEMRVRGTEAWVRVPGSPNRATGCTNACDVWGHQRGDVRYYRHGEAIAKVSDVAEDWLAVVTWIQSIHAHEMVTA